MEGFKLEDRIAKDLKREGYHYKRIKTRNSGFKGDNEIADFYVYSYPNLIYLEAKSVKGRVLPFSSIRVNQAVGLYNASQTPGVKAGFIVEFREANILLYIPINVIDNQLAQGIKSISLIDALESPEVIWIDKDISDAIIKIKEG